MRERAIEQYFARAVLKRGGVTYKWVSPGRPNVPDRIVIWPLEELESCVIHFVEMKSPTGSVRAAQAREHKRLRQLGVKVFVLKTKTGVDNYVRDYAWT